MRDRRRGLGRGEEAREQASERERDGETGIQAVRDWVRKTRE